MNYTYNPVLQTHLENRTALPDYLSVSSIRTEIRTRRKHIIGSHISILSLVCTGEKVNDGYIEDLAKYLAAKTICFWSHQNANDIEFCRHFYRLTLHALISGNVGNESIDDIIQLAECLVRSREVFITVLKELLPVDMIAELFHFIESYDTSYFVASFEDAVLGAVAVLLGALADPAGT